MSDITPEEFARKVHAWQTYGDGGNYADSHLYKVAKLADIFSSGMTNNLDVVAVAWLHDILEDTDTKFFDLVDKFGNTIACDVVSLTRDGTESDYIEKLRSATPTAKLVKLCDIICNLSNLNTYKGNKERYALKKSHEINACLGRLI